MGKSSKRKRAKRRQAIRDGAGAREAPYSAGTPDGALSMALQWHRVIEALGESRKAAPNTESDGFPPSKIYRFFGREEYADAFCAGRIRVSTLGLCRGYEDPKQGDAGEAKHTYISTWADSNSMSREDFRLVALRAGVDAEDCTNSTIAHNVNVMTTPDAYVLCCTEHFSPELLGDTFGRFCVEISDSIRFFNLVTVRLKTHFKVLQGRVGKVTYRSATFVDAERGEVPMGFMKDPDKYAEQREVRMLWHVASNAPLTAFDLHEPEVTPLCRRIA